MSDIASEKSRPAGTAERRNMVTPERFLVHMLERGDDMVEVIEFARMSGQDLDLMRQVRTQLSVIEAMRDDLMIWASERADLRAAEANNTLTTAIEEEAVQQLKEANAEDDIPDYLDRH